MLKRGWMHPLAKPRPLENLRTAASISFQPGALAFSENETSKLQSSTRLLGRNAPQALLLIGLAIKEVVLELTLVNRNRPVLPVLKNQLKSALFSCTFNKDKSSLESKHPCPSRHICAYMKARAGSFIHAISLSFSGSSSSNKGPAR